MLETLVFELAKSLEYVKTLTAKKVNKIVKVDDDKGIYVETEASQKKFQDGESAEPYQLIEKELLKEACENFIEKRTITSNDLGKARGRSSFVMALFSVFPFVEVKKVNNQIAISLKTFVTEDLPCRSYNNLLKFLEEVRIGKYDPKNLSKQTGGSTTSLYYLKSDSRQDLRILGFLDKDNDINTALLNAYSNSNDKERFLADLILKKEYFQIALFCLELLREFSNQEKKKILIELGMLLVRSSTGDNWMVESVAEVRTHNLLKWLENVKLIDEEWRPTQNYFEMLRQKKSIMSNIRAILLKIITEYLTAKREGFRGHPLGAYVRNEVPDEFYRLPFIDSKQYLVTASVGQGNWAYVPWIAIMNRKITDSTQKGYYLCYLFSEDMKSVYLAFMQGVTKTSKEEIVEIKSDIRRTIPPSSPMKIDDEIYLGNSLKAREYAFSTAAYIKYDYESIPDEQELVTDLKEMIEIYENYIALKNSAPKTEYGDVVFPDGPGFNINEEKKKIMNNKELVEHIHSYITSKGFLYDIEDVINLFLSLKTKPFVILSGISGTGKTKMVQLFAESVGANEDNGRFTLIPVRPDWHDSSDLLGYTDIKGDFKEGPLLKVIQRAAEQPDKPHFVLLDEMNLARVEHYFSDILSVMETRKWEDGKIVTSYLFPEGNEAGADSNRQPWKNVRMTENLYIIGTVNMDETTHPFSKKVLDRANTIEFNEVDLKNLDFLKRTEEVQPVDVDNKLFASKYLNLKDAYEEHEDLIVKASEMLVQINKILQEMYAHVGYRVRDEICYYLAYNAEGGLLEENKAVDFCILQKILPRLSGSDQRIVNVLRELYKFFTDIEYVPNKPDYAEELLSAKYPRSAGKVLEMLRRHESDGFTSFWIS